MEQLLIHIGSYLFTMEPRLWVAWGEYDRGLGNRMGVRRNKKSMAVGRPVHAFWVRRTTGVFYFFATDSVPGTSTPASGIWLESDDAFTLAKGALTLPGIGGADGGKGINFSSGWKPPSRENQSGGNIRLAKKKPVAHRISTEAAARLECAPPSPTRWGGWAKPPEVKRHVWNAMIQTVAEEITNENGDR